MPADLEPVWHLYVVRSRERDALRTHLDGRQVRTLIHYPTACHLQGAYSDQSWPALPLAERLQAEVLSLPMAPYLSASDVREVADAVCAFATERAAR